MKTLIHNKCGCFVLFSSPQKSRPSRNRPWKVARGKKQRHERESVKPAGFHNQNQKRRRTSTFQGLLFPGVLAEGLIVLHHWRRRKKQGKKKKKNAVQTERNPGRRTWRVYKNISSPQKKKNRRSDCRCRGKGQKLQIMFGIPDAARLQAGLVGRYVENLLTHEGRF